MAGLSTSAFAALPDPHSLADRYKSSLQQMRSEDDLVQFVSKKIAPDFGLASTLASFSNDLTNGHYSKQMQQLINMPVMKWNGDWGMLGRYELEDMQRIVNKNARVPVTERITPALGQLGEGLAALSLVNDMVDAINGNDDAKISAIANMLSATRDMLIKKLGSTSLNLAMAGVAFLDYALSQYTGFVIGTHQKIWWEAYVAYMEAKYGSPLEWAILAHDKGAAAVDRRLKEFWDDSLINADQYYFKGNIPPNFQHVSGKFLDDYRKNFAARYYKDFLHATVTTYARKMAERAQDELALKAEKMGNQVALAANEIALIKKVFDSGILDQADDTATEEQTVADQQALVAARNELAGTASQIEGLAGAVQSQCQGATAALTSADGAVDAAATELNGLRLRIGSAVAELVDPIDLLQRANVASTTAASALQRIGDSRNAAQQLALALCEKMETLHENDNAQQQYAGMPGEQSQVQRHAELARSALREAQSAATDGKAVLQQARAAAGAATQSRPDGRGVQQQLESARNLHAQAGAALDAARASVAGLSGLRAQAAAASAGTAGDTEAQALLARINAAAQRGPQCIEGVSGRYAASGEAIGTVGSQLSAALAQLPTTAGPTFDAGTAQQIEAAGPDARASADTGEIFAESVMRVAEQSQQCLRLADAAVREERRNSTQARSQAAAALDRCDVRTYQNLRADVEAMERLLLDQKYQMLLDASQQARAAIDNAAQLKYNCNYDTARTQLNAALQQSQCQTDQDALRRALADIEQAAQQDYQAQQLIQSARNQRNPADAQYYLQQAEQTAQCPQQRFAAAEARANVERRANNDQALANTRCTTNAEPYWDEQARALRCRCLPGYQPDTQRGLCLDPRGQVAGVQQEPDFNDLLQGMMQSIEQMQNPQAQPRQQFPQQQRNTRLPPTTQRLSGRWGGQCKAYGAVGGQYSITVTPGGVVSGAFSGDDSGPISGTVASSGQMRAGGGNWVCNNNCSGSWGR